MHRSGDGRRIAQRLRRHPVLAVPAMQIAAEHAEAIRERTGIGMEERLLLDRIALHAADIAPWHSQPTAIVETHFTHAHRALRNRALVSTRVAPQPPV